VHVLALLACGVCAGRPTFQGVAGSWEWLVFGLSDRGCAAEHLRQVSSEEESGISCLDS